MAFHWQTFKTRAFTAIIFVVIMMSGLLWNRWSYFLLFSVVHFGAWIEYQKLIRLINQDYKSISAFHQFSIMLAGWCMLLFFTNQELQLFGLHFSTAGLWLGLFLMLLIPSVLLIKKEPLLLKNLGYSLLGLLYISLSLSLMVDLRNHWIEEKSTLNLTIPLLIIFTIWISDTMAYIVGSMIGKTPLSSVSPKKTWEGTIGGVFLAVIVMCVIPYFTIRLSVFHVAVIALLASIAGTIGDLFESKLKRMAGVKDSGHIMPGHGGFLDRFDSLFFASTVCWFYVRMLL